MLSTKNQSQKKITFNLPEVYKTESNKIIQCLLQLLNLLILFIINLLIYLLTKPFINRKATTVS